MLLVALLACHGTADSDGSTLVLPTMSDPVYVVPSEGLPAEVADQASNNNLSVATFDGRTFLAFRTAPSHFASTETVMYVLSSADEVTWDFEASFALGTDVREPQLLAWDGHLYLYFAVLGSDPLDFEPQGTKRSERTGPGEWTEPVDAFDPTFIPWRMKVHPEDGAPTDQPYLTGYTGGANVYSADPDPIDVHWLTTSDGTTWGPVVDGQPVVSTGGGSESDFAFLDDGSIVAVIRDEAGDETGFGSKICTAPADDVGDWTCEHDPRKYDSPLVFRNGEDVWLIGRRTLNDDGKYEVADASLPHDQQYVANQITYWQAPKRCSLWKVDPDARTVTFAMDLPSAGDTCFPDLIDRGDGVFEVWNYTSPTDQPDLSWVDGQHGTTAIYRLTLEWSR